VDFHVFEDVSTDLIELSQLDLAQLVCVVTAPVKFTFLVHGESFSGDVLHGLDDILGNLTVVDGLFEVSVTGLFPKRYKSRDVLLVFDLGQGVASQVLLVQILHSVLGSMLTVLDHGFGSVVEFGL